MVHRFHTEIAKMYGVTAAVIFFNIAYWVEENEKNKIHYHDGYYWVYCSIHNLAESTHDYLTENQIRRAIQKLLDDDMLYKGNYNKKKYDRTYWYTLTPKAEDVLWKIKMRL